MSTIQDYISRVVDAAPPLTAEQRDRLALLLNGGSAMAPRAALNQTLPPIRKCALYRHFDDGGELLYVGISVSPSTRRNSHARHAAWMEFASTERVEWFDNEAQARDAEREAIATESPLFNKVHADPDRDQRLAMYLIERRAFHLLKPL